MGPATGQQGQQGNTGRVPRPVDRSLTKAAEIHTGAPTGKSKIPGKLLAQKPLPACKTRGLQRCGGMDVQAETRAHVCAAEPTRTHKHYE